MSLDRLAGPPVFQSPICLLGLVEDYTIYLLVLSYKQESPRLACQPALASTLFCPARRVYELPRPYMIMIHYIFPPFHFWRPTARTILKMAPILFLIQHLMFNGRISWADKKTSQTKSKENRAYININWPVLLVQMLPTSSCL